MPLVQNVFLNILMRFISAVLGSSDKTRAVVRRILTFAEDMAADTDTPIDDVVVRLATAVVEDDETWDMAWVVIQKYLDGVNAGVVASTDGADADVVALAEKLGDDTGIDPITIIALIMQLIEWIREWRNR